MPDRAWEELVAEGRQLAKDLNQRRWEIGDLALQVAPMGADRAHNGATEKLERFAEEIGVEFNSLRVYRTVASAWSHDTRVSCASWTVHREMMDEPDRAAELRRMAEAMKGGTVTVDIARILRGAKAPSRPLADKLVERVEEAAVALGRPEAVERVRSIQERAAAVKAEMADPAVNAELRDDPKARAEMSRVLIEHDKDVRARTESIKTGDPVLRKIDERNAALDFISVCDRFVREVEQIRYRVGVLSESDRKWMRNAAERTQMALDAAKMMIAGTDAFDEAVADLLREASNG